MYKERGEGGLRRNARGNSGEWSVQMGCQQGGSWKYRVGGGQSRNPLDWGKVMVNSVCQVHWAKGFPESWESIVPGCVC